MTFWIYNYTAPRILIDELSKILKTLGTRSTMNTITSILDANFVYGASKESADKLRTFQGGFLASNPENRHLGLKDLLPPKLESPDSGCVRPNNDTYCFMAGDSRANQQMMLIAQHTIFMREHNRMAHELGQINPHWNDEKIFQVNRRPFFTDCTTSLKRIIKPCRVFTSLFIYTVVKKWIFLGPFLFFTTALGILYTCSS